MGSTGLHLQVAVQLSADGTAAAGSAQMEPPPYALLVGTRRQLSKLVREAIESDRISAQDKAIDNQPVAGLLAGTC